MRFSRKRFVIAALLIGAVPVATWALAPLFIETRADVAPPSDFPVLVLQGTWQGVDDFHYASGTAKILGDGRGQFVLRIEAFRVRNGPDIHLFLSEDRAVGAGDVDLGSVPATMGNYNVAIPIGFDPATVHFALVHCVPANFLFASAELT